MSQPESNYNPVSPLTSGVITLFEDALPDVRFPDLDITLLTRSRDELCTAQREVDAIEVLLAEAREKVRKKASELAYTTERALAYVSVFADGNESLTARIQDLRSRVLVAVPEVRTTLRSSDKRQSDNIHADKKRGRPRQAHAANDLELPVAAPLSPTSESASEVQ